ncbi:MAG: T9SS type A sorting domain-containing protein [Ignavibacteriaceae bacterium]
MKKLLPGFAVVLLLCTDLSAQWNSQISPITSNYTTVHFFDSNNGWAFGASGSVKTTDGGLIWTDQSTPYSFKKVSVVDQNTAFALTGDKYVYKTLNGGATWTQVTTPAWTPPLTTLDGISFLSSTLGFVGGTNGYIFRTTNGGTSWSLVSSGGFYISDLYFLDANTGFAARWGGQWSKTTNGGTNWTGGTLGSNYFYSVFPIDANNVFLAGASGTVYRTTNGGSNWFPGSTNISENLYDIFAAGTGNIWAAGTNGKIIYSTDGGNLWALQPSGITNKINSLFFTSPNSGWAVGEGNKILHYYFSSGSLSLTSPLGGEFWNTGEDRNITWTASGLTDVRIDYSTDSGVSWMPVTAAVSASVGTYAWSVPNTPSVECLVKISDTGSSGLSDMSDSAFTINVRLYGDVDLNSHVQAFDGSVILKYLVGALELTPKQLANARVSGDTTASALDASLILRYVVQLIDSLPWNFTEVASADINLGAALINSDKTIVIPLTLANGINIASFEGEFRFDESALEFTGIKYSSGISVEWKCLNNRIKFAGISPNGTPPSGPLLEFIFRKTNTFFSGKTTVELTHLRLNEEPGISSLPPAVINLGDLAEDGEVPGNYSLSQNYPNPFNSTTVVRFTLPCVSFVTLKLYDLAGNEIETLLKGEMKAGFYEIEISSLTNKQASGVYFLKMNTVAEMNTIHFTKIIKMIMTK